MILSKLNTLIRKFENLAKDPESFFTNKYQKNCRPNGFRIELYIARKCNSFCSKFKWIKFTNLKTVDIAPERGKSKVHTAFSWQKRQPEKKFCPYCEKTVVPKRLHKLDIADIIITLLTAGLWAIFLFAMYLFIRRCPVCNYNLRGFKYLSDKKKR